MSDRLDNCAAYTTHTGTSTIYIVSGGPADRRRITDEMANGQETVFYMKSETDFMHFEGRFNTAGNTVTVLEILSSSNGGAAVNWAAGQKLISCSMKSSDLDSLDLIADDGSKKTAARAALGMPDVQDGKPANAPLIMAIMGDSNTAGWNVTGTLGQTLNPNVHQYVGSTYNNAGDDAGWSPVDPAAPLWAPVAGVKGLGYIGGDRGNMAVAAADRYQRKTGRDVLLFIFYMGGAHPDYFDPSQGMTPGANNMWEWVSRHIAAGLADLAAGINGAPYTYAADHLDVVIWQPAAAIALGSAGPAEYEAYKTMSLSVIAEMENQASALGGGYCKQFHTHYIVPQIPQVDPDFVKFDGHVRLDDVTGSHLRVIPVDSTYPMVSGDPWHFESISLYQIGQDISRAIEQGPLPKQKSSMEQLRRLLAGAGNRVMVADANGEPIPGSDFTSDVDDEVGAVAWKFDTKEAFALGVLLQLLNNGTLQIEIDKDGNIAVQGAVNAVGDVHSDAELTCPVFNTNVDLGGGPLILINRDVLINAADLGIAGEVDATGEVHSDTDLSCPSFNTNVDLGSGPVILATRAMLLNGADFATTGKLTGTGDVVFSGIPTSDPLVAGEVFRSGNDLRVSTG